MDEPKKGGAAGAAGAGANSGGQPPKAGGANNPGKPDKSQASATEKDIEQLKQSLADKDKMLDEMRREIGRLGDELGQHRQVAAQNVNIDEVAKNFKAALIQSENPVDALAAINQLVEYKLGQVNDSERQRVTSYRKAVRANKGFAEIPYHDVVTFAYENNLNLNEMTTTNGMERVLTSLYTQRVAGEDWAKKIADARDEGARMEREKLRATGLNIPTSGDGKPPPEPDAAAKKDKSVIGGLAALQGFGLPPSTGG